MLGQDSVGVYVGVGERVYYCFLNMKFPELIVGRKTPVKLKKLCWQMVEDRKRILPTLSSLLICPFLISSFSLVSTLSAQAGNTTDFAPELRLGRIWWDIVWQIC